MHIPVFFPTDTGSKSLKEQQVAPDEMLVSVDVSALLTSITVPITLDVISRKSTEHINLKGMENFLDIPASYPKAKLSLFWN